MLLSKNPEFKRLVWAQSIWLNMAALFALPALLVLLLVMSEGLRDLEQAAMWMMLWWVVLTLGAVGCIRVAQSMAGEVHAGTWDGQCMSGIDAGRFVLGKVFGSTAWLWASALVLALSAVSISDDDLSERLIIPFLLFAICLTGHLATLAAATAMSSGARPGQRGYGLASAGLGWVVGITLLIIIYPFPNCVWSQHILATDPWPYFHSNNVGSSGLNLSSCPYSYRDIDDHITEIVGDGAFWFSVSTHSLQFKALLLTSAVYFAGFAAWRLMRREFRHVEAPSGAPLFMFILLIFGLGLLPDGSGGSIGSFTTFWFCCTALLYGMLLIEKRDQVQMMRLARRLYGEDRQGKLTAQIPGWVWCLALFTVFSALVYPAILALQNNAAAGVIVAIPISILFCMRMLRDALVLGLAAGRAKRTKQGMDWVGPALLAALFVVELILFGIAADSSSAYRWLAPAGGTAAMPVGFVVGWLIYFGLWLIVLGPLYNRKLHSLISGIKTPMRTISAEKQL